MIAGTLRPSVANETHISHFSWLHGTRLLQITHEHTGAVSALVKGQSAQGTLLGAWPGPGDTFSLPGLSCSLRGPGLGQVLVATEEH